MRTIILLIVYTGNFPGWVWPVACIWYACACIVWWMNIFISDNTMLGKIL